MRTYKTITSGYASRLQEKAIAEQLETQLNEAAKDGWQLDKLKLFTQENGPYGFLAVLFKDS